MSSERRACERLPLNGEIDFRRVKETAQTVAVRDLSPAGCSVEVPVSLLEGERVWVRLPGLESLPSIVRWSGEWTAGAMFDRAIHPAVFEMVADRLNQPT